MVHRAVFPPAACPVSEDNYSGTWRHPSLEFQTWIPFQLLYSFVPPKRRDHTVPSPAPPSQPPASSWVLHTLQVPAASLGDCLQQQTHHRCFWAPRLPGLKPSPTLCPVPPSPLRVTAFNPVALRCPEPQHPQRNVCLHPQVLRVGGSRPPAREVLRRQGNLRPPHPHLCGPVPAQLRGRGRG